MSFFCKPPLTLRDTLRLLWPLALSTFVDIFLLKQVDLSITISELTLLDLRFAFCIFRTPVSATTYPENFDWESKKSGKNLLGILLGGTDNNLPPWKIHIYSAVNIISSLHPSGRDTAVTLLIIIITYHLPYYLLLILLIT